jgi:Na+-transporting NADH:ubiquinone oxidoreductase subunit NqrE
MAVRSGFLSKYFYFAMSLLFAVVVVVGFSQTINQNLFHAAVPRPTLLWFHGAAFASWVVFVILQASLVRLRKVSVHRLLGWFGAGLATVMVVLGFTTAVVMTRFDTHQLHEAGVESFMAIPFWDMIAFGSLVALAIYWRKKPELHKRLMLIATCCLMDAPFGRFDYLFNNNLYFVCLDVLILLGVGRDLVVDRRVHKVYLYALPVIVAGQAFTMYLDLGNPGWWQGITHALIG